MSRSATLLAPLALLAAASATLAGCGHQPMYAGGGRGAVAQGLAAVEVAPIEGGGPGLVGDGPATGMARTANGAEAR